MRRMEASQELAAQRQQSAAFAVSEEAVVANAHKAARQQMQQEAAQELVERKRHQPLLITVGRIAPAEGHLALFEREHGGCSDSSSVVLAQGLRKAVAARRPTSCGSVSCLPPPAPGKAVATPRPSQTPTSGFSTQAKRPCSAQMEAGVKRKCRTMDSVGTMAYQRGGYYYRSRRVGSRVLTEYLGAGRQGKLIAQLDAVNQEKRRTQFEQRRRLIDRGRAPDDALDTACEAIQSATQAVLLTEGYHTHKGQWRKQRGR